MLRLRITPSATYAVPGNLLYARFIEIHVRVLDGPSHAGPGQGLSCTYFGSDSCYIGSVHDERFLTREKSTWRSNTEPELQEKR